MVRSIILSISTEYARNRAAIKFTRPINQHETDALFLPYESADCVLLHSYFAQILKDKFNVKSAVERIRKWDQGAESLESFSTELHYRDKLRYLFEISENSWPIAQGMMDHYRRICSIDSFFGKTKMEEVVVRKILTQKNTAEKFVQKSEAFILPDLGYTFARTIHYRAIKEKKPVFLLNPHGVFKALSMSNTKVLQNEPINSLKKELNTILKGETLSIVHQASDYLERRFSGLAKRDYESKLAFAKSSSKHNGIEKRKVLFLHCFRDTIRFFPSETIFDSNSNEFCDYFEWTDWAFSQIAKEPKNWWIKSHPNSRQYGDEVAIIDRLLERHNLPRSLMLEDISVSSLVQSGMPIFTHSGTVIMEAAAVGNRSFSIDSGQYPASFTNLLSAENAAEFYRMSVKKLHEYQQMTEQEIMEGKILLFVTSKESRPLFKIIANNPHKQHPSKARSAFREVRAYKELEKSLSYNLQKGFLDSFAQELSQFVIQKGFLE